MSARSAVFVLVNPDQVAFPAPINTAFATCSLSDTRERIAVLVPVRAAHVDLVATYEFVLASARLNVVVYTLESINENAADKSVLLARVRI